MAAARRTFIDRLAAIEDGTILKVAFFAMLAGTIGVLIVDYRELGGGEAAAISPASILPPPPMWDPDHPMQPGPALRTDRAVLEAPLTATLEKGGVLALTGTIDPGARERVAAEIEAHGEYVKQVSLDSPGGSVEDALAIGKMLREHGFTTEVGAGALCASSCPLVLAGGVRRTADPAAAIGLHQVYAAVLPQNVGLSGRSADTAMAEAQTITARIGRYLTDMGVDPALWLKAMETPAQSLAFLTSAEMTQTRLVTNVKKE
jgi:hypothetical protein